jgi:Tfp pilus assembly protein PilF
LRELKAAAQLTPDDVNVPWRLARFYGSIGKKDEARTEFDKASSINKAADDVSLNQMDGAHARPA